MAATAALTRNTPARPARKRISSTRTRTRAGGAGAGSAATARGPTSSVASSTGVGGAHVAGDARSGVIGGRPQLDRIGGGLRCLDRQRLNARHGEAAPGAIHPLSDRELECYRSSTYRTDRASNTPTVSASVSWSKRKDRT